MRKIVLAKQALDEVEVVVAEEEIRETDAVEVLEEAVETELLRASKNCFVRVSPTLLRF